MRCTDCGLGAACPRYVLAQYEPNARLVAEADSTPAFAEASDVLLDMTRYYDQYYPEIGVVKNLSRPYR